ncbi:MAG: hypothetical protein V1874_15630 [Spirochaetota bacterium]
MPEKIYEIFIDDITKIIIFFETENGEVINFVIKLLYFYKNSWYEIERYDCFHNSVHKDIYNTKGNKKRQILYPLVDLSSGLNMAIEDFKTNYKAIIWRFLYGK